MSSGLVGVSSAKLQHQGTQGAAGMAQGWVVHALFALAGVGAVCRVYGLRGAAAAASREPVGSVAVPFAEV
ncbi:hypothetical protein GCM10010339_82970 [Streptomyces alanosinicus]|uniref:Uncharacterized protein n=1 Tax=Streptomyces alanosinicus TaxID=68171 RepID=A0A918YS23_9ACTN|nr:hypothetical protein GCM10010339_82970 [Streptomyces alanosinicus]